MPTESGKAKSELSTWQEIAHYLGVSYRTAQVWHKTRGLPVSKIGGRVSALVPELEAWKRQQARMPASRPEASEFSDLDVTATPPIDISGGPSEDGAGAARGGSWYQKRRVQLGALGLLGLLAISFMVIVAIQHLRPGQPVSFRVEGNLLRTLDAQGRQVWRHTLPDQTAPGGYSEDESLLYGRRGLFADLDGDGRAEFLFIYWPPDDGGRTLFCFDSEGKVLWTRSAGRDVRTIDGATILANYWINRIAVLRRPRQDGGRIVVVSHHEFSWTSQLIVLTAAGKQVAEYWHPGWIYSLAIADLDGDGVDEIVLGGLNEGFRSQGYGATLVVLDSRSASGQGEVPDGDPHKLKDIAAGKEAAVLLFPEFSSKPAGVDPYCFIGGLKVTGDHLDTVLGKGSHDLPYVHYEIDRRLGIASITPADSYKNQFFFGGVNSTLRQEPIRTTLGRVRVLKNRFAEQR